MSRRLIAPLAAASLALALLAGMGAGNEAHAAATKASRAKPVKTTKRPVRKPAASAAVTTHVTAASTMPAVTTIVAAALPPVATPAPTYVPGGPLPVERLQTALDEWRRKQVPPISSVTIGLRIDGQTWVAGSHADGIAPPDLTAPFRIASVTKTFTAALAIRASEIGKLAMDQPIPSIVSIGETVPPLPITPRQLLTHTSGLVDYTEAPGYASDKPISPQEAAALTFRAGNRTVPGMVTRYVNSNYIILGLLLEQIEGKPFGELVTDMAGPMGLRATRLDPPDRLGWAAYASGGLMSTAGELAEWGSLLFDPGRVLSSQNVDALLHPAEGAAGLGTWPVCPCRKDAHGVTPFAIGHHAALGGLFYFPDRKMTLVGRIDPNSEDTYRQLVPLGAVLQKVLATG